MAITVADHGLVQSNTIAMNSSAGVGDLVFACTQSYPTDSGGMSDSLSGSYKSLGKVLMGDGELLALYYKIVTVAGTATFTAAGANVDRIAFARFTGFAFGAQVIIPDASSVGGTGTALASTSFNASQASEYAFALIGSDGGTTSGGFSFSELDATDYLATFWDGPVSSGSPLQITGTYNSSTTWGTIVQGFYDGLTPVISVIQSSVPTAFNATASATTTLTGVTAGNTIIAAISHIDTTGGVPTFTLSDGQGSYNQDVFAKNTANGAAGALIGSLYNAAAGTHSITATASTDASTSQGYLVALEVSGLKNPGFDRSNANTGDSQTPSTVTTGTLAQTNELIVAVLAYFNGGSGGTYPPTGGPGSFISLFNHTSGSQTYDADYQVDTTSTAGVSASWGTITTGGKWAAALATYQAAGISQGATLFLGPGISPVKRLIFQTRNLSSQTIPSGAISARGYSKSYGFAPVGQQSNASAKGYSKSYGFARSSGPQSYFAELFRGPGISSDWPQTFLLRNLATTQSSGVSSYISAVGYSKSYGRAASGSGAASARGFSKSYGRARVNGVTSLYATGYSLGYGFGNGFGVSLGYSNATGYSKGYGRAQFGPQTILMPNVLGDTQANAETILQNLGLSVNVGDSNSLITPPGIVMAQFPIAGTLVTVGQLVSITVSIGPFVRAANPNLGYKVTARVFSLEAMASQAWGSEFRAPDHRVYQWSNGRGFDSTDLGTTGIYQKGTSTS